MNRVSRIAIVSLTLMCGVSFGRELRFEDLPDLIRSGNRHVQAATLLKESAESRTGYLARSYLPHISATGGYETFKTGPYPQTTQPYSVVEANLNLFRGGRDLNEDRYRKGIYRSSNALSEKAYLDELAQARKSYWDLVFQREMLALLRDGLAQNDKNLAAANRRIRSGVATETDRIEFELNQVELDQDLKRAQLAESASKRTLNVLLGFAEDSELTTVLTLPHEHDDALLQEPFDLNLNQNVVVARANQDAASAKMSIANRWWVPSIDVYGSYSQFNLREKDQLAQRDRNEGVVGVKLRIQVFDGLESRTEAVAWRLEAHAHESNAEQTKAELNVMLLNAREKLKTTHELIHSADHTLEKGTQYFSRTLDEYARGVKNSVDVLSASQKFLELRGKTVELKRDHLNAKIELLGLLGK